MSTLRRAEDILPGCKGVCQHSLVQVFPDPQSIARKRSNSKEDPYKAHDDESCPVHKHKAGQDPQKLPLQRNHHPVHRSFVLLFFVDLPVSFPVNNEYIHTTESTSHNSNGHSVVDERASRFNQNKPVDTPSKQERNAFTTSSNRPTPFRFRLDPATAQAQWQALNGGAPEQ